MSYRDKYRYYFSFDGIAFNEVFLNKAPVMTEKQDEDQIFFRRKLQNELIISSSLNPYIFRNVIVDFFRDDKQNVRVKFRVLKDGELDWEGSQSLRSCKIDIDLGTIAIKPTPDDNYKDLLDTFEKEIDIVSSQLREHTLTITQTSYPEQIVFQTEEEYNEWVSGLPNFENEWKLCTHPGFYPATYKRQRVQINPGDWYRIGDEYAYPSCSEIEVIREVGIFRRLDETINMMLNELGLDLAFSSSFFNDLTNYITNVSPNPLRNIYIAQKSDVKRTGATEQANRGIVTLKAILDWLFSLFNAKYTIEDGKLRVEHLTYFENTTVGLDLTGIELERNQEYEEDSTDLVRTEQWEFSESKTADYLPERTIEYNKDRTPQTVKKYLMQSLTTDIRHVLNNPDDISDAGFVIVVADDSGEILAEPRYNGYYPSHNMHLSIVSLQQWYWKYLRPLKKGVLNGVEQEFFSETRKRKQKALSFQLTDSIHCDVNKLVRTNLFVYEPNDNEYYITAQTGKIVTKSHDLNTDRVTIELKYNEDDVTKNVTEAVAVLLRKAVRDDAYIGLSVKGTEGTLASNVESVAGKVEMINLLKTNDENEYVINVGFVK